MKKSKIGYFIIASAIVWGAVIIGCSLKLKGTPYYDEISPILIGGAIFHLIFIKIMTNLILSILFKKNKLI